MPIGESDMSFSQSVKKELVGNIDASRHCRLAELCAFLSFGGRMSRDGAGAGLVFESDYIDISSKYDILYKKTLSGNMDLSGHFVDGLDEVDGLIIQQTCCKRAYLRGAFLMAGSISNPNRGYHFEIVCNSMRQAEQVQQVMMALSLDAKIVLRHRHYVVYLKEGEQIVSALGYMGAVRALMDMENVRILKDMRNIVNRRVNCEAANITKTVNAAVRQTEDIKLIEERQGLGTLPENLREIALARLEHPDVSLKDLGDMLTPPIGKSGVNHRLRKISEIADKLR